MGALVLAAGLGTRLRPLTYKISKCMVRVGGKPVLEHLVEHLNKYGITEIIVNLHWLPEQVYKYFGTRLLYFYEPELLGHVKTEHRLYNWLSADYEDSGYLVLNGDTLTDINIDLMVRDRRSVLSYDKSVYTGIKYVSFDKPKKRNFHCYWQDIGTFEGLKKAREYYAGTNNLPKMRKQGG